MRTLEATLCLVAMCTTASAGPPEWLRRWGGRDQIDYGAAVAVDHAGDVLVLGATYAVLSGEGGLGDSDVFLAKLSPRGERLWLRQFGTAFQDLTGGLAIGKDGSIYAAVTTLKYVPGPTPTPVPAHDAFLSKFDTHGNEVFRRMIDHGGVDHASSVTVDSAGAVIVTGFTSDVLQNGAPRGPFLVKYDAYGREVWTRLLSPELWAVDVAALRGTGATDVSRNVDIVVLARTYPHPSDALVIAFDAAGHHLWETRWGTPEDDAPESITSDGVELFVAGSTLGAFEGHAGSNGSSDAFLTRLSSTTGEPLWTRQWGTRRTDVATQVVADGRGLIQLLGLTAVDTSYWDSFWLTFDREGTPKSIRSDLTAELPAALVGMTTDPGGRVYVTGAVAEAVVPDTDTRGDAVLMAYGTPPTNVGGSRCVEEN